MCVYIYIHLKWFVSHDDALSVTVGLFPGSGAFLFIVSQNMLMLYIKKYSGISK